MNPPAIPSTKTKTKTGQLMRLSYSPQRKTAPAYGPVGIAGGGTAGWLTTFQYDGLGRLRFRSEYQGDGSQWVPQGVVAYLYDGMRVIQERDANNWPQVAYTRGTDLSGTLEG